MTPRELPRPDAVAALPNAFLLSHLVVIVNAGLPVGRAAQTVWSIAGAVAGTGRRIALVDLHFDEPALHAPRTPHAGPGIVDVFQSGESLQAVTLALDPPGLFFVPAGVGPGDPTRIWGHTRWPRLARGFESEGALLLLYVPADGLAHMSARPDRLVILTTDDYEADRTMALALAAGLDDGPEVIVVMDAEATVQPMPVPPFPHPHVRPPVTPTRPASPPRRRRRRRWAGMGGAIGIGLAIGLVVLVRSMTPAPDTPAAEATPVAAPRVAGDSLFYAVQVAAFKSPEAALAQATEYEAAGWLATVTPVRLGQLETWYRLLIGAASTSAGADSALTALWERGLVEHPNGTILRTPHALRVGTYPDRVTARDALAGLRARGVAAYIAGGADGRARLLVGAFEAPEQARLADSILGAAGLTPTLVARAGITR